MNGGGPIRRTVRTWLGLIGVLAMVGLCSGCMLIYTGVPGSGVSASESRDVDEFERIDLSGVGKLNVTFGTSPSLEITGDDNLLEYIETSVDDGTLYISVRESIQPKVDLVFDVVATDLSGVDISGAAQLNVHEAKLDVLEVDVSGSATANLTGTADQLEIELSGAGNIDADGLEAQSVRVSVSGAGKASVHARQSLDATISGVGLVRCAGNPPEVTRNVSGVGRITMDDE